MEQNQRVKARFLRSSILVIQRITKKLKKDKQFKKFFNYFLLKIISIHAFCTLSLTYFKFNSNIIDFCQYILNSTTLSIDLSKKNDQSLLYCKFLANANIFELWLFRNVHQDYSSIITSSESTPLNLFKCSICFDTVHNAQEVVLPCKHSFCLACIVNSMYFKVVPSQVECNDDLTKLMHIISEYPRWFLQHVNDTDRFLFVPKSSCNINIGHESFTLNCPFRCCVKNDHFNFLQQDFFMNTTTLKVLEKKIKIYNSY